MVVPKLTQNSLESFASDIILKIKQSEQLLEIKKT